MGRSSQVCAAPMRGAAAGLAVLLASQEAAWCDAAATNRCDSSSGGTCLAQDNLLIQKPGVHRAQASSKVGSLGPDFIQTPFSALAHRSCVVEVPSGTQRVPHPTLHDHHILKFVNGTNRTLEPCSFPMPPPYTYRVPPDVSTSDVSASGSSCAIQGGQASSGPLASYGSKLSSTLERFTANVYVPKDPVTAAKNTWLYWWIGSLPEDYSHVLQPVLGYNKAVGWEISSWDCCPGGNQIRSQAVTNLTTYDKIRMSIVQDTWVRDQYQVQACSEKKGECATLNATNTGSQLVPLIQFETYNVGGQCDESSCRSVNCNFLPTSNLVAESVEVKPATTWQPVSTKCWSLTDCGWTVDQRYHGLWAYPPSSA